jgi:hydrogenase expression/formation protein HypC
MCLGIPGKVVRIERNPLGMTVGKVEFGGVTKDVSLAYVPEVKIGDYVIVHVGFALSTIDEAAAVEISSFLALNDELEQRENPAANGEEPL